MRRTPLSAGAVLLGGALVARGATGRCALYRALGLTSAERSPSASERQHPRRLMGPDDHNTLQRSITIGKPQAELYAFLHEPWVVREMYGHLADVEAVSDTRWRWRPSATPAHGTEWHTTLIEDRADERIAWATEPDAPVQHRGSIDLRPAPRDLGTVVTLRFESERGGVAAWGMKLFGGVSKALMEKALRRLKSLAETGEVPTLEDNPSARKHDPLEPRASQRPAQRRQEPSLYAPPTPT